MFKNVIRLLTEEPWACTEDAMRAMTDVLATRLRGDRADLADMPEVMAALRIQPGSEGEAPYDIVDGVAVVDVEGTLVKRAALCMTSMQEIRERVEAAVMDSRARAVLLSLDSPGGTVDGTSELGAYLREAGTRKPLYAYADGCMCSGAYWLGSQCREIAAPDTAVVGSIGVVTMHWDNSVWYQTVGSIPTYLQAGEFKAAGNDTQPLNTRDRAYIQERIDQSRELFVAAVAQGRKLSPDDVRATEARVYLAAAALKAGLIDRIVPDRAAYIAHISAIAANRGKEVHMDVKQLRAEHPALVSQIEADAVAAAVAGHIKDKEEATAKAAVAERERVTGLVRTVAGDAVAEAVTALAASGIDAAQAATVAKALGVSVQQPQTTPAPSAQQEHLDALRAAHGSQGVTPSAAQQPQDFMSIVEQRKKDVGCSTKDAMAWATESHPEAHKAYLSKSKEK